MRKPVVLITGAGGEIGHGLIERLAGRRDRAIVTIDVSRLEGSIAGRVDREFTGSILDRGLLDRVLSEFRVELVFHLAALLSTRSEFTPVTAHQVNVEGTLNLLEFAQHEAESHRLSVQAAKVLRRLPSHAMAGRVAAYWLALGRRIRRDHLARRVENFDAHFSAGIRVKEEVGAAELHRTSDETRPAASNFARHCRRPLVGDGREPVAP